MDRKQLHATMREAYAHINREFWGGRLPRCRFFVADLSKDDWYGYHDKCKDGVHRITLDSNVFWTVPRLYRVMLHETIHSMQYFAKSKRTQNEMHGRFFQYHHLRIFGYLYTNGDNYIR